MNRVQPGLDLSALQGELVEKRIDRTLTCGDRSVGDALPFGLIARRICAYSGSSTSTTRFHAHVHGFVHAHVHD